MMNASPVDRILISCNVIHPTVRTRQPLGIPGLRVWGEGTDTHMYARAHCQAWSGDLVTITSDEEKNVLALVSSERSWMGLRFCPLLSP
jgi:hypothetical protein